MDVYIYCYHHSSNRRCGIFITQIAENIMAPELKKVIADLTQKYGKIKPSGMAGTWKNSISQSVHSDDILLWFETSDGRSHQIRIGTDWKIKSQEMGKKL
jgi:hypothetical protein